MKTKKTYTQPTLTTFVLDTEETMQITAVSQIESEQDFAKGDHGGGHFTWGNLWKDEDFAEDEDLD